jgi:hypothetical protein
MRFLHYTLLPDSPVVAVYKKFQHADLITVSTTTYRQLTYCDPLAAFKIMSAQDVTQNSGSAVLYRPEKYLLIHFMPDLNGVTVVLQNQNTQAQVAVTAVSLPEHPFDSLLLLKRLYARIEPYIVGLPHIIAGHFQMPRILNASGDWLIEQGFHDLLGVLQAGPTRFRHGFWPEVADYVFYRGPIAAMECTVVPLVRPQGHSPIYVFFFICDLTTHDL